MPRTRSLGKGNPIRGSERLMIDGHRWIPCVPDCESTTPGDPSRWIRAVLAGHCDVVVTSVATCNKFDILPMLFWQPACTQLRSGAGEMTQKGPSVTSVSRTAPPTCLSSGELWESRTCCICEFPRCAGQLQLATLRWLLLLGLRQDMP